MKCLSGTQLPDTGEIFFAGKPVRLDSPTAARRVGIETVFQDLSLAPDLDPAANLFLGREILRPGLHDLHRGRGRCQVTVEHAGQGRVAFGWSVLVGGPIHAVHPHEIVEREPSRRALLQQLIAGRRAARAVPRVNGQSR